MELTKGKWYKVHSARFSVPSKNERAYFMEFDKIDSDGRIRASSYISERSWLNDGDFGDQGDYTYTEVTDQEIIEGFPENHPMRLELTAPNIKDLINDILS